MNTPGKLEPLPLQRALLFFLVPAVLFRIVLYNGTGLLLAYGASQAAAVILAFLIPSLLLLLTAVIAMRLDGYALSWSVFRERFRFRHVSWRAWLWIAGGAIFALVGEQLLAFSARILVVIPLFTPPPYLSFLNPAFHQATASFLGVPLLGNWAFLAIFTSLIVVQVAAEECWWRGYIFPRQELLYGKWTWLVHGLLWAIFHFIFYPWAVLVDLFFCITLAFITQCTKNTWVSFCIHLIYNGITSIFLLLVVLGRIH